MSNMRFYPNLIICKDMFSSNIQRKVRHFLFKALGSYEQNIFCLEIFILIFE